MPSNHNHTPTSSHGPGQSVHGNQHAIFNPNYALLSEMEPRPASSASMMLPVDMNLQFLRGNHHFPITPVNNVRPSTQQSAYSNAATASFVNFPSSSPNTSTLNRDREKQRELTKEGSGTGSDHYFNNNQNIHSSHIQSYSRSTTAPMNSTFNTSNSNSMMSVDSPISSRPQNNINNKYTKNPKLGVSSSNFKNSQISPISVNGVSGVNGVLTTPGNHVSSSRTITSQSTSKTKAKNINSINNTKLISPNSYNASSTSFSSFGTFNDIEKVGERNNKKIEKFDDKKQQQKHQDEQTPKQNKNQNLLLAKNSKEITKKVTNVTNEQLRQNNMNVNTNSQTSPELRKDLRNINEKIENSAFASNDKSINNNNDSENSTPTREKNSLSDENNNILLNKDHRKEAGLHKNINKLTTQIPVVDDRSLDNQDMFDLTNLLLKCDPDKSPANICKPKAKSQSPQICDKNNNNANHATHQHSNSAGSSHLDFTKSQTNQSQSNSNSNSRPGSSLQKKRKDDTSRWVESKQQKITEKEAIISKTDRIQERTGPSLSLSTFSSINSNTNLTSGISPTSPSSTVFNSPLKLETGPIPTVRNSQTIGNLPMPQSHLNSYTNLAAINIKPQGTNVGIPDVKPRMKASGISAGDILDRPARDRDSLLVEGDLVVIPSPATPADTSSNSNDTKLPTNVTRSITTSQILGHGHPNLNLPDPDTSLCSSISPNNRSLNYSVTHQLNGSLSPTGSTGVTDQSTITAIGKRGSSKMAQNSCLFPDLMGWCHRNLDLEGHFRWGWLVELSLKLQ